MKIDAQLLQLFWQFRDGGQFFRSLASHQILKVVDGRNKGKVSIFVSQIHACRDLGRDFGTRMKSNIVSELLKLFVYSF